MNARHQCLPKALICALAFLMAMGSQLHSQKQAGAVIIISMEGGVTVKKADGTALPPQEVAVGKSIYDGHTLEGPQGAKAVLLFSNGSLTTLDGKDYKFQFVINQFKQETFEGSPDTLGEAEAEPSQSTTKLSLNYGEMYFKVKKLNAGSSFEIDSPIGSAGIRGTDGELRVKLNENGTVEGSMSLRQGTLNFTPPSGKTIQMESGQKATVKATPDGQQIGATQTAILTDEENAEFTEEATTLESESDDVTVETLKEAMEETDLRSKEDAIPAPPEGNGGADVDGQDPAEAKEDPRKAALETIESTAAGAIQGAVEVALGLNQDPESLLSITKKMSNAMALESAEHAEDMEIDRSMVVAATIRGGVEGAIASATIMNAPPELIQSLSNAASDASSQVVELLDNMNVNQVLATANPEELIADNEELTLSTQEMETAGQDVSQSAQEGTQNTIVLDSDNDGLGDADEERMGTDPENPDTDGDLLMDGYEFFIFGCNPSDPDTDGDGISDSVEIGIGHTDPLVPDSFSLDSDIDAIPDNFENILGTDPLNPDTDGDGWHDGFEIGVGSDPRVHNVVIQESTFTVSPIAPGDPFPWLMRHRLNPGPWWLRHLW